jgi:hypothetical protein
MSLYYLKGSKTPGQPLGSQTNKPDPNHTAHGGHSRKLFTLCGILLIIAAAILQAAGSGIYWTWEHKLMGTLPASWQPPMPKVLLLSMGSGKEGFAPLDVAIALRGLGKLHPARVLIHGRIAPATPSDAIPLMQGVLSRLREEGMEIIIPQSPSLESRWKFLPLCCYEPPRDLTPPTAWLSALGKAVPSSKESFLPSDAGSTSALPLFAMTDQGEIIGSLWWMALTSPSSAPMTSPFPEGPIWLLGKRLLIFPNHAAILLNRDGALTGESPQAGIDIKVIPLADFLLKLEQKERGSLSPDFDALWENATVVIGVPEDLPRVSLLASIQARIAFHYLPILLQVGLCAVWIILFAFSSRFTKRVLLITALSLLILSVIPTIFAFSHGWILPYISPLLTSLLLLLPLRK